MIFSGGPDIHPGLYGEELMDCCGALFNGDKTAGETAALIQSKVAIYLAEQYG